MSILKRFILTVALVLSTICTTHTSSINVKDDSQIFTTEVGLAVKEQFDMNLDLNTPVFSPLNDTNIRITSKYGMRFHPILHRKLFHYGVDMVSSNKQVVATGYGVIKRVRRSRYGYGNYIIIDHLNGFSTRYAHLDKIFVQVGDTVNPHQLIGIYGNVGLSTGPHLHYEIRYKYKHVDPSFITKYTGIDYLAYLKNSSGLLVTGYYTKSINNGKSKDDNKEIRPQYYLAFQRTSRKQNY